MRSWWNRRQPGVKSLEQIAREGLEQRPHMSDKIAFAKGNPEARRILMEETEVTARDFNEIMHALR